MLQPASASRSASDSAAIIGDRARARGNADGSMVLNVVVMAAGQGTRMRSALPKVLHRLGGRHLLQHVLDAAAGLGAARVIVVTGHGAAEVERQASAPGLSFVRQEPQLGTGHALQQAAPLLDEEGTTLILNGDVPLIETATLQRLVAAATALSISVPRPSRSSMICVAGAMRSSLAC